MVAETESIVQDNGLNVLFNNAAFSPKSTRLNATKADDLIKCFQINTIAPIMLTKVYILFYIRNNKLLNTFDSPQALYPLLKKAAHKNPDASYGVGRAAIINMSSTLGSISGNVEGGLYAYRTSKCGLNAATKSMSIDLKGDKILCVSMHPGWVKTEMGGRKAPLEISTCCSKMIETIMNLSYKNNGRFLQWDGKELSW